MFKKRFKREDKTYVVMKYQNKNSAVVLLYFPCEEKKKLFFYIKMTVFGFKCVLNALV